MQPLLMSWMDEEMNEWIVSEMWINEEMNERVNEFKWMHKWIYDE